ncbi:MAG: LexA family protein [Culicoidibacterales bacterium]
MRSNEEIITMIEEVMTANNVNASELARRTGLSKSSISRYLKRQSPFSMKKASAFSEALGISLSQLLGLKVESHGTFDLSNEAAEEMANLKKQYTKRLPVISAVSAGTLETAIELSEEYVGLTPSLQTKADKLFAIRANGDSMNKLFASGTDVIAIKATECTVKNGDIVIVSIDNELSIKRFFDTGDFVSFMPESTDSTFQPIVLPKTTDKQIFILGKAIHYQGSL